MTEKALKELLQLLNQQGEPVKLFEIRSYGKSELAMLYFPDAKTKKGAMNNLNYWISYCTELREKLRELNSPPQNHEKRISSGKEFRSVLNRTKPAQLPILKCRTFAMRKEICGI